MNHAPIAKQTDSTAQTDRQPSMDWLHEEPTLPQGPDSQGQPADAAAPDTGGLSNKKPKSLASKGIPFIFGMLAMAASAYFTRRVFVLRSLHGAWIEIAGYGGASPVRGQWTPTATMRSVCAPKLVGDRLIAVEVL